MKTKEIVDYFIEDLEMDREDEEEVNEVKGTIENVIFYIYNIKDKDFKDIEDFKRGITEAANTEFVKDYKEEINKTNKELAESDNAATDYDNAYRNWGDCFSEYLDENYGFKDIVKFFEIDINFIK